MMEVIGNTVGNTGLIAIVGVIFIAIASLFGLVIFASREDKFEDVVAAQRHQQEVLLNSLQSSKPSKSRKKWAKIKNQKGASKKENAEHELEDHEVEEIEAEQILIDESETIATENSPRSKNEDHVHSEDIKEKKSPKQKHKKKRKHGGKDSHEKEVHQANFDDKEKTIESVIEQFLDEAERNDKKSELTPAVQTNVEELIEEEIVEEIIEAVEEERDVEALPTTELFSEPSPPQVKKSKNKPKSKVHDQGHQDPSLQFSPEKLMKEVKKAPLSAPEVQLMIEVLQDKQNELDQWKKPNQRNDPIAELKRQISELDMQVTEERKTAQTAAHKNKELKQELNQERTQQQKFQQQANTKITQQAQELQAYQKRMEVTQEKHMQDLQNAQAQIQHYQESLENHSPVQIQRLKEENNHLKAASLRAQQLSDDNESLLLELGQLQQGNKQLRNELDGYITKLNQREQQQNTYDQQISNYEAEFQKLNNSRSETENVISKRLADVNDHLLKSEALNTKLSLSLETSQKELEDIRKEKNNLKEKFESLDRTSESSSNVSQMKGRLSETEREITHLKLTLKGAEAKLQDLQEGDEQKSKIINKLEKENKDMKTSQKEKIIVDVPQMNGVDTKEKIPQETHNQLIKEKDRVISELNDDIQSTKKELEGLAKVIQQEKNEKDTSMKQLQDEIEERKKEQKYLQEIVDNLKSKNNGLREKNWKAMDALGKAETNVKVQTKKIEECTYSTLKKINPTIKIMKQQVFRDTLLKYEEDYLLASEQNKSQVADQSSEEKDELQKQLEEMKSTVKELSDKVSSLEAETVDAKEESKKATLQCSYYQGVLEETEHILNKLQEGVEAEVSGLEKKVQKKDEELKQARDKISSLEALAKDAPADEELAKVKSEISGLRKDLQDKDEELKKANQRLVPPEESSKMAQTESEVDSDRDEVKGERGKLLVDLNDSVTKFKGLEEELKSTLTIKQGIINGDVKDKNIELEEAKSRLAHLENEINGSKGQGLELRQLKETHSETLKQLKKLQDKVKAVEDAGKHAGKSNKDKDKLIADTDQLKVKLNELTESYNSERETTDILNTSVGELQDELEKSRDKMVDYEKKYKETLDELTCSQQRIKELESDQLMKSQIIEKEIAEAMDQQMKTKLSEKDKQLEAERQANRQLHTQLQSLTSSNSPPGTKV